jgi:hypothetical protein
VSQQVWHDKDPSLLKVSICTTQQEAFMFKKLNFSSTVVLRKKILKDFFLYKHMYKIFEPRSPQNLRPKSIGRNNDVRPLLITLRLDHYT